MINPKQVFLGCPFRKRVSAYIHLAQDIAEQYSAHLVFGDNNPSASNIRDQAFRLIATSRIVILDVASDNVNVGIEYGYSQGVGRQNTYLLVHKPMFAKIELPAMYHGLQYKSYRSLEGFRDRIEGCLARHFRKSFVVADPEDPDVNAWLKREILDVVNDLGRISRPDLAAALNCVTTEITGPANQLWQEGKIGRETNGPSAVYVKQTSSISIGV